MMGEMVKQQRWKEVLVVKTRDAALGRAIKGGKGIIKHGPRGTQKKT